MYLAWTVATTLKVNHMPKSTKKKPDFFYYLFDESRKRRIRATFNTYEEADAARREMGTILSIHTNSNPRGKPYDRKDFDNDD